MNIFKVLKTVLETASSLKAYPIKKPLKATIPCIVYRRVSTNETISHSGDAGLVTDRIQVICTHSNFNDLMALVLLIETELIANNTDWQVSLPVSVNIDDFDEEDGVYSNSRDYFITYLKGE